MKAKANDNDGCLLVLVIIILFIVWGMSDVVDTILTKVEKLEKKIESTK